MNKSGRVIPLIIPKSDTASRLDMPPAMSAAGRMMAMSEEVSEVAPRINVTGVLDAMSGFNFFDGFLSLPPLIKKTMEETTNEKT